MKIIVTGGASGLGLAISKELLSNGHEVLVTYSSSIDSAVDLVQNNSRATATCCDYTDPESVRKFLTYIDSQNFDVLINNAWRPLNFTRFTHLNLDDSFENIRYNLLPTMQITQSILRKFKEQKSGKVITILTDYLSNTFPTGASEYVASKSFLSCLVKSWAVENARFNISSNAISPSIFLSGMTKDLDERVLSNLAEKSPNGKLVTVEEISLFITKMILFPSSINGENFEIDSRSNVI